MHVKMIVKNLVKNFIVVYVLTGVLYILAKEYTLYFFIPSIIAMVISSGAGISIKTSILIYAFILLLILMIAYPLLLPAIISILTIWIRIRDIKILIRMFKRRFLK